MHSSMNSLIAIAWLWEARGMISLTGEQADEKIGRGDSISER